MSRWSSRVPPVAAYILQIVTGIATILCSHLFHVSHFPPQVSSLFAGYDSALLYALNPCGYISKFYQRYGPMYRVSLGPWRLVVLSSGDAISSAFKASSQLLSMDTLHRRMMSVVAGVESNFPHLHHVTMREVFPLLDKTLSHHSLDQNTQAFGLVLLSQIQDFTRDRAGPVSLRELANIPLFTSINRVLFGVNFPTDIYGDFRTLDQSIPYRMCRSLLWPRRSDAARMRLLVSVREYLQRGEDIDGGSQFSRGFMKIFKDNNMQSLAGAQLALTFMWVLHNNTLKNAFFSLSFLLVDPDGFSQVQEEIDAAVEKFGSLEGLLVAGPTELDDPSFKLLTSAIMETLRFTNLHGIREAVCDFDLGLPDETTVRIKKGEFVFGNIRTAHMESAIFPNPEKFVVDRFAQKPYQKKRLQTEGYPFHSLGGGKHICKGRWLAIYELKVLLIILLHMFDFSPAESLVGWRLPRVHPCSVGVVHTEDEIFVRLSPRQAKNGF